MPKNHRPTGAEMEWGPRPQAVTIPTVQMTRLVARGEDHLPVWIPETMDEGVPPSPEMRDTDLGDQLPPPPGRRLQRRVVSAETTLPVIPQETLAHAVTRPPGSPGAVVAPPREERPQNRPVVPVMPPRERVEVPSAPPRIRRPQDLRGQTLPKKGERP